MQRYSAKKSPDLHIINFQARRSQACANCTAAACREKGRGSSSRPCYTEVRMPVCGYIYDPAVGDPDSGIAPGTAFKDIPDDWVCPVCGVSKDEFEPLE